MGYKQLRGRTFLEFPFSVRKKVREDFSEELVRKSVNIAFAGRDKGRGFRRLIHGVRNVEARVQDIQDVLVENVRIEPKQCALQVMKSFIQGSGCKQGCLGVLTLWEVILGNRL